MSNELAPIDQADIVIVGNGIAGLTAAVEARRLDPDASIVIMTSQNHPTINTPALKQFAVGKLTREQLLAYPTGTERVQRLHLVNAQVEEIHAQGNYVSLAGGKGFGYGSLLIATGSSPQGLPADLPGRSFDGVLTLHRLQDYLDLRRRLPEVEDIVVIGGGVHAVETVMGMLYWGLNVHWLIRGKTFSANTMDPEASEMVLDTVRKAGAKIYTDTELVGVVGRVGVVAGVVTTQQEMIPCQLVLSCTGTGPVMDLAKKCDVPMKTGKGILVDDQMRTSVRNIYAAGDVAALRDPLTGKYAPRAVWYAAVLQGRTVAAAMTGADQTEPFGCSWHATRLGNLAMLTVGNPLDWPDSVTPLIEQRKDWFCRLSLVDDRLVGYFSLGDSSADSLAIKKIIDEGLSVRTVIKDLLKGEFEARKFFSAKRTFAVERMITTGQLPTPLPALPAVISGESRSAKRLAGPQSGDQMLRLPPPAAARQLTGEQQRTRQPSVPMARIPAQRETGQQLVLPNPAERQPSVPMARVPDQRRRDNSRQSRPTAANQNQVPANDDWLNGNSSQIPVLPPASPSTKSPPAANVRPPVPDKRRSLTTPPAIGQIWSYRDEPETRWPVKRTEPLSEPSSNAGSAGREPSTNAGSTRREQFTDGLPQLTSSGRADARFIPDPQPVTGNEDEGMVSIPERQFIKSPQPRRPVEREDNPHPSRSLWHYTRPQAAIPKNPKR
jgi:NADPH-dependent 2,4-dienoyl-CoA reductase/sulfur reductase-like enzyme